MPDLPSMIFGYMVSQTIHTAGRLGIPDSLHGTPRTIADLAERTGAHPPTLLRILRALAALGIVTESEPDHFALTQLGEPLASTSPHSLHATADIYCDEVIWRSWGHLLHSARTGGPAFEHVYGMHPFEYFAQHPRLAVTFNQAMSETTRALSPLIVAGYDFGPFSTVVDVGGGEGTLMSALLAAHPALSGVLFDSATGVRDAPAVLKEAGITDRCQIVEGDFFTSIPGGGDLYLLKQIIHDWGDQQSLTVLENCRKAISPGGRLLLIEYVVPETAQAMPVDVALLDLTMLVVGEGKERTAAEFESLLGSAGFSLAGISDTLGPTQFRIIEAV